MAWHVSQLNDRILKLMRPEDRKLFGKAGMTQEEAIKKAQIKSERDLQNQIENYLRLKGIEPIRSRMDKATTNNVGTPDFLFAVGARLYHDPHKFDPVVVACAWEVKLPKEMGGKDMSDEQRKMAARLVTRPNAWRWALITKLDEAIEELRSLGMVE